MARPSKLNQKQWEDIKSRLLKGEKAADLAREYKISRVSISERFSERIRTIKDVSNQILIADQNFKALPVSEQISVINFVDDLKAISSNLASAGKYGAINANKLSLLANSQLKSVNEDNIEDSGVTLKMVSVLTDMANEASKVPLGLLASNKEQVQKFNAPNGSDLRDMTDDELFQIARGG
jgi:hypothetical protein